MPSSIPSRRNRVNDSRSRTWYSACSSERLCRACTTSMRIEVGTKALPRHQSINGFKRVPLRRQRRQSLVRVKKPELTHQRPPNHAIANDTRIARFELAIFRGAHKTISPQTAIGLSAPDWNRGQSTRGFLTRSWPSSGALILGVNGHETRGSPSEGPHMGVGLEMPASECGWVPEVRNRAKPSGVQRVSWSNHSSPSRWSRERQQSST